MIRSYQGRLPQIPATSYVDQSAQVLGDVTLGEHSSVWMNAVLRGDVNSITVGANSNVQDCAVLHGQRYVYPVTVGDLGDDRPQCHGAWMRGRGRGFDRHGHNYSQRLPHRRGIDHCRGRRGPGAYDRSSANVVGGRAGQAPPRTGRRGSQANPALCAELPRLHGNIFSRSRQMSEPQA